MQEKKDDKPLLERIQNERFYGRRVGRQASSCRAYLARTLSHWQLLEPELQSTQEIHSLFSSPYSEYWLEIGFGNGEHLLQWMQKKPDVGIIGVEPFVNGLVHCLREVERDPAMYKGRLRLIPEDVRPYLSVFPVACFAKIYVLFSDPWPKKRHAKRRLITASFLETLSELLQPGGELILAHDHFPYVEEIFGLLQNQTYFIRKDGIQTLDPTTWPAWPAEWPLTRYGEKALTQGRPLGFFVWEKKSS